MSNDAKWTPAEVPDQRGRIAIASVANGGLGSETALALAARGAHVMLGCREAAKARSASVRLVGRSPAEAEVVTRFILG